MSLDSYEYDSPSGKKIGWYNPDDSYLNYSSSTASPVKVRSEETSESPVVKRAHRDEKLPCTSQAACTPVIRRHLAPLFQAEKAIPDAQDWRSSPTQVYCSRRLQFSTPSRSIPSSQITPIKSPVLIRH